MANTIKFKRGSGSDPGTSDLSVGEIAIRTDTAKLFTKNDAGSVVSVSGGVEDGDKGDITVSSSGSVFTIDSGVVTSAKIANDTIVNADINSSAAIDGSKISPAFTSDITGTGNLTLTSTDAGSSAAPELELYRNSSSPTDADYLGQLKFTGESDDGSKEVYAKITGKIDDASSGTEDGIIEIAHRKAGSNVITGRFKSTEFQLLNGTGLSVNGNISTDGTVDGRDVAADGTKLDGIESGATADQTKSDIDALGIAASTAATLATARNIGGVSFDGSANINLPGVNSSGNQDTSGNAATATALETARTIAGVSFDGTANISLNNNAITNGAGYITATLTNEQVQDIVGGMLTGNTETGITVTYQDGDGTIDFVVGTLNQDTTGNAATATALETARNIGGVSFDGTANINLPGVNTSGNQDTSGTAAIATTVTVADESSDTTCFPLFATAATGNLAPKSGSNLAFNSSNGTLTATAFSGDGSALTGISAGATGGGSDEIFYENGQNVTTDYTITNGKNAMSAGPITIDSGVTVTVGAGETLTIV